MNPYRNTIQSKAGLGPSLRRGVPALQVGEWYVKVARGRVKLLSITHPATFLPLRHCSIHNTRVDHSWSTAYEHN